MYMEARELGHNKTQTLSYMLSTFTLAYYLTFNRLDTLTPNL